MENTQDLEESKMFTSVKKAVALGLTIATGAMVQSVSADYDVNNGGISVLDDQDIVVSLKSNPMANLEQACLAVTFARMLSMNSSNNVTLFVTLDGVSLAAQSEQAHNLECITPWEPDGITLEESLEEFLKWNTTEENPNHMVICPLCWKERYPGEKPKYGVMPGLDDVPPTAIGKMLGNADKILDF